MKREWILEKNHISYWLRQLRKDRDLVGPLRNEGKDVVFMTVEQIHEVVLDLPASLPSPKEFLFPQYESMLRFNVSGKVPVAGPGAKTVSPGACVECSREGDLLDLADRRRRLVFGVRSCDVSAVRLLDRFFLEGFRDPYYEQRRKNILFVSIVCNNPDPTCFCIGLGTGPYLEEGFDIQLTDLGDRYFVQASSAEGIRTVKDMSFLFRRPRKADLDDQYEVFLSAKARFHKRISLESSRRAILEGRVKDSFWRRVTERCFECGGCVYECPLCTCFTVADRRYPDAVERIRLWDTCLFKGFTRMAGGILPNGKRMLRTKRWFYHKLVHYPEVFDEFGCVGCGRCAVTCPGRIDMATIATEMKGLDLDGSEQRP
ncbi:MAG: hypothetical protein GXO94_07460 [Nitrospirae bacterium]|nr:hypothetical protein [Nitrospirota bacterium]